MPMIADQPIVDRTASQQSAQPQFIDEVVAALATAVVDLTKVVDYLAATKTLPLAEAAAHRRLHDLCEKLQSD
ncbi:hypothetical protein [Bradyrhizobium diazoefficiens]